MAISLKKHHIQESVTKKDELEFVSIYLSWSKRQTFGKEFDLDISCFLLGNDNRVANEKDFVFYNNPVSRDGAVSHFGDNREGESDYQDHETIYIDLPKLDPRVERVVIAVSIYDAHQTGQTFGLVENARISVFNRKNHRKLAFFYLNEAFSNDSAIIICEFCRKKDAWIMKTIDDQNHATLSSIADRYGLTTE